MWGGGGGGGGHNNGLVYDAALLIYLNTMFCVFVYLFRSRCVHSTHASAERLH